MALSDLFGIDSTAGSDELNKAIQAIQGVRGPTAEQLTLPELQKYVQAGVLTPQQYQAISADPNVFQKVVQATQDNSGANAQKAALQQLGGIAQAGGSTPINEANLRNNINTTNQAMKAARGGIEQQAQERGVAGGGLEFINKLMNEQGNAEVANQGAVNAGANNAKLALDAITQQGQLGGQLQGQSNQMTQAQADAAQQIAQYNSQLQSQANQYNTQNANQAQQMNLANSQDISNQNIGNANMRMQYNTQIPQTMYQNDMQKANAVAGAYGNKADVAQKQAQNQNAFTGNLIGTGAKLGAAYMTGGASAAPEAVASATKNPNEPDLTYGGYAHGGEVNGQQCYAEGGEVHDHAICMEAGGGVPGNPDEMGTDDNVSNDTVDAKLSPGEIVLPRSVAQSPNAPQEAQQFVSQTKGMPSPTVNSFAEALAKLEENGLELRLAPRGQ